MPLNHKIVQHLTHGEFLLKCPTMTLQPMSEDQRQVISGAGYIKQNKDGKLEFELLSQHRETLQSIKEMQDRNGVPGKLLDTEDFYSLSAMDYEGNEWLAEQIRPRFISAAGTIVTSELLQLKLKSPSSVPGYLGSHLSLFFRGEFELPCNVIKRTSTIVEGRKHKYSSNRCIAKFSFNGYDFFIEIDNNLLTVKATISKPNLPPYFEERATETLEFVLGRRLDWIALEKIESEQSTFVIQGGAPTLPVGSIGPPLEYSICNSPGDFWKLFELFLSRIINHEAIECPPLSHAVRFVLESARTYLEFQELALGVAVERILKTEFSSIAEVTSKMEKELSEAQEAISKLGIDATLKKRIHGAIATMKDIRPADIMHKLIESGKISKEYYTAWQTVRHGSAHAQEREADQKHMDLVDRLLALFYRLIFLTLNYTGHYTDYGSAGWPTKLMEAKSQ